MSATAPTSAGNPSQNVATGAFMPLASIRKHWKLGLKVFGIVLLLGIPLAWLKGQATYSATAVIYVAPRFVNILQESRDQEIPSYQQYRQFIDQQAHTVTRYDILTNALARLGPRRSLWQKPEESERRAVERLQAALAVVAVENTYLITVTLESKDKDGLEEIVNSVVQSYLEQVHSEDLFYAADQRLATIAAQREELVRSLDACNRRRLEIAQELGVTTFAEDTPNAFDDLLSESRTALADAQRQRLAAEAKLDVIDSNRNKDAANALLATSREIVASDPGLNALRYHAHQRRTKLLQDFSGLSPEHPLYAQVKKELEDIDTELTSEAQKLQQSVQTGLLEQRKADVRLARQVESGLTELIEQQRQKSAWFARNYSEALQLDSEIERLRKQLETIDTRVSFFKVESNAPGFIRLDTPARPPEIPVKGGRKKMLVLMVVAALLCGLAVAVGIDLLDNRIKTSGQVEKILGYPPLAEILEHSGELPVRRVIEDQKRRLSLALAREHRSQHVSSILLTSVKPGAGVTTLAFDLAVELAELGLSVLLLEANPTKPDPRYAGPPENEGLIGVLGGYAELRQNIVRSEGALPDRLPVGVPLEPHLHSIHRLRSLLDDLKSAYALVLIDAPPILLSADVEFLSNAADMTLLVIGAKLVKPGELKRAARILERADPRIVSFIVTRLEISLGGGYYQKMVQEYADAEQAAQAILQSQLLKPRGQA
jgi:Mrp family chromosome partitioning ATPase